MEIGTVLEQGTVGGARNGYGINERFCERVPAIETRNSLWRLERLIKQGAIGGAWNGLLDLCICCRGKERSMEQGTVIKARDGWWRRTVSLICVYVTGAGCLGSIKQELEGDLHSSLRYRTGNTGVKVKVEVEVKGQRHNQVQDPGSRSRSSFFLGRFRHYFLGRFSFLF